MLNMVYENIAGEYIMNYPSFNGVAGIIAVSAAYIVIRHKDDITDIINKIKP